MSDVQWREAAPGRVTISQAGPLAARLFGVPFLAVGAYFLIFTRRTRTPIASGAFVQLRYERGAERTTRGAFTTSSRTGFLLPVHLVSNQRHVLLALFADREKEAALAFARRISSLLGIDIQDRCIEGGEVTSGGIVVTRVEDAD